jgi:hypothetical protein
LQMPTGKTDICQTNPKAGVAVLISAPRSHELSRNKKTARLKMHSRSC